MPTVAECIQQESPELVAKGDTVSLVIPGPRGRVPVWRGGADSGSIFGPGVLWGVGPSELACQQECSEGGRAHAGPCQAACAEAHTAHLPSPCSAPLFAVWRLLERLGRAWVRRSKDISPQGGEDHMVVRLLCYRTLMHSGATVGHPRP